MEAESVQKLYRMDNVVKDNSQQRVTWGGSGGVKEGSTQLMSAASVAWIGQGYKLLQTEGLAPGMWSGVGLWPTPAQPQLWGKKSCTKKALPNHLNEKTEISDTPSCLFKMTMFLLVLKQNGKEKECCVKCVLAFVPSAGGVINNTSWQLFG